MKQGNGGQAKTSNSKSTLSSDKKVGCELCIRRVLFRVLLLEKYFGGFSFRGKVFFCVVQKYLTLLIHVCKFAKSTP